MWVVVAYDISNNKRRTKVVRVLEGYGMRVQESVFECRIDQGMVSRMETELSKVIKQDEDSIRLYCLPEGDSVSFDLIGIGVDLRGKEWHHIG